MTRSLPMLLIFAMVLPISFSAYAEDQGSIDAEISYVNGDRASYNGISLKIFQDSETQPFKEIDSISSNPFDIENLPLHHKYKIEVYSNDMHASVVYADLNTVHQDLNIVIPLSGGMRINAFYNDGQTPIEGATISVKSQYKNLMGTSITDTKGQTIRFWLAPTVVKNDYYTVDVMVAPNLVYSFSPVFLLPGQNQEVKVVTVWSPVIDNLITAKVYDNQSNVVSPSEGKFTVDVYDQTDNKVSESPVNLRGEAYFYNLKVGDYTFKAIDQADGLEWGSSKVTMSGAKTEFDIFQDPPVVQKSDLHPTRPVKQMASQNNMSSNIAEFESVSDKTKKTNSRYSIPPSQGLINSKQMVTFPDWMKNDAKWWSDGLISDQEFFQAMGFMIQQSNIP